MLYVQSVLALIHPGLEVAWPMFFARGAEVSPDQGNDYFGRLQEYPDYGHLFYRCCDYVDRGNLKHLTLIRQAASFEQALNDFTL